MGRVGTHMAVVFAGWGPSGRRFKSCLPDSRKPASEAGSEAARMWMQTLPFVSRYQFGVAEVQSFGRCLRNLTQTGVVGSGATRGVYG